MAETGSKETKAHAQMNFLEGQAADLPSAQTLKQTLTAPAPLPTLLGPTAAEFYNATNQFRSAVFLPGAARDWPANQMWSPAYLKDRFGDTPADVVRLVEGVLTSDAYGGLREFQQTMSVRDFVDSLDATESPMISHYWRQPFIEGPFRGLFNDLISPAVIDEKRMTGRNLWVGAKGLRTSLHFDSSDNIFCQVYGTKRFRLYAPPDSQYLGVDPKVKSGSTSQIDPSNPDLERFPEFRSATPFEVVVRSGDQLFIPAGWWHHVTSETVSISVNFWYQSALALALKLLSLSKKAHSTSA